MRSGPCMCLGDGRQAVGPQSAHMLHSHKDIASLPGGRALLPPHKDVSQPGGRTPPGPDAMPCRHQGVVAYQRGGHAHLAQPASGLPFEKRWEAHRRFSCQRMGRSPGLSSTGEFSRSCPTIAQQLPQVPGFGPDSAQNKTCLAELGPHCPTVLRIRPMLVDCVGQTQPNPVELGQTSAKLGQAWSIHVIQSWPSSTKLDRSGPGGVQMFMQWPRSTMFSLHCSDLGQQGKWPNLGAGAIC